MQFFWNDDGRGFRESKSSLLLEPRAARGAALGDLDGDTDPDVAVSILDSEPLVLIHQGSPVVSLSLVGRTSNREGIGATVRLAAPGGEWVREIRRARGYLSSSEPAARFPRADRVTIHWPSGTREEIGPLEPGRYIVLEGRGRLH
jgi:hypothetical protein